MLILFDYTAPVKVIKGMAYLGRVHPVRPLRVSFSISTPVIAAVKSNFLSFPARSGVPAITE